MQRVLFLLITSFIVLGSCTSPSKQNWTALIPEKSSLLIIPEQNVNLVNIQETDYAALLDDITSSSSQQISSFAQKILTDVQLKAVALYPASSTKSELVWITETAQDIDTWVTNFYKPLTQNYYTLKGSKIHKVNLGSGITFYVAQLHNWLIFSSSSLALESSIRSYAGYEPSMSLPISPAPGQLVVNTPHLDEWVEQFINVSYRPSIKGAFDGSQSTSLTFPASHDFINSQYHIQSKVSLSDTSRSSLITTVSSQNLPISLDRYIASNAAAFALLRKKPNLVPTKPTGRFTELDSYLMKSNSTYNSLSTSLDIPFAFEAFSESGLSTNGEFLFLRKLLNPNKLKQTLDELAEQNLLSKIGQSYFASSTVLSELIGSELSPFRDFFLSISRDVVVISSRRGLSESVESDRARRRVMYYNNDFSTVKNQLPKEISGFFWAESNDMLQFLRPFLMTDNAAVSLLNRFDIGYMVMQKLNDSSFDFTIRTMNKQGSSLPYQELWVTPLFNNDLTGAPILGDIVGSSNKEVIYATTAGNITAIANDGTVVMQASTDGNTPIGSPVLYDWYGNNQPVVMIGAGTKIFAWNQNGRLLPKFPIEVGEQITAPISVADVRRNGIPEVIVATDNRRIHIIDGRGENVSGWPQSVNSVVTSTPVFANIDGTWSVWAFSQNILHSWLRSGAGRPGFPQFINAGFNGSPLAFENSIFGAGSDGKLYSIGKNPSFSDSLGAFERMDSISVKSIFVTNNELLSITKSENVLLRNENGFYRKDLLLTQSRNGSIFGFDILGELQLTKNLGQPASETFSPMLTDINSDGNQNLIALAEFGRIFAWDILTTERLYDLPTSGMKYPIITDLNGDGQMELIAQTREGLRCWTILKKD